MLLCVVLRTIIFFYTLFQKVFAGKLGCFRNSWSFRMAKSITIGGWLDLFICSFLVMNTHVRGDTKVPITILETAIPKGAVCLDGSAPAYSYVEGTGNGSDSWIVYLEGGGLCDTPLECYQRSQTYLGSSVLMDSQTTFYALLDSDCTFNLHFCNWHRVYIHYCDGSSFMSDVTDSKRNLYFRGARIFNVMMEEMLAKGMKNAKQAILSGSSSAGIATLLHCDKFQKLFSDASRVKCIPDSGFFIHGKGLLGDKSREEAMANAIKLHELASSLPVTCTSKMNAGLCMFPEYFIEDIQTPVFLIESAFDQVRLTYFIFGNSGSSCVNNLMSCNSTEIGIMRDSGEIFIKTLMGLKKSSSRGMFVHSCYLHTHFMYSSETWMSITLANKTIEQAITDWYFDRGSFQEIDFKHVLPLNCTHSFDHKKSPVPQNGLMSSLFSSFNFFSLLIN